MVVKLGLTKGGQRRGLPNETVVSDDLATIQFLSDIHKGKVRGDNLVGKSPQQFRMALKEHVEKLHLNNF